jgi:tetrapyrrole methylase family protein/MazG family protein
MSAGPDEMRPRVVVVGLGPAGAEWIPPAIAAEIDRSAHRFLRTRVHPAANAVTDAVDFDDLYEREDTFDAVYGGIVTALAAAATEHGEILYAVPGSPLVLERTVEMLRAREDLDVVLYPAMSFLDLVWARLGIDPVDAGVRLVDGHRFAIEAAGERGPLLIAHTHADWVLSEIKLAVEDASGDEPVTILRGLGTPDESIVTTTWSELDRSIEPDHLTCVYVPELAAPVGREYVRFHELTRTLREQCPWDREQTHTSLVRYVLEEAHEVADALIAIGDVSEISSAEDDALIGELGDLLYQIELHATIAEQQGRFTMADVCRRVHDKLVRRHPHVFGPDAGDRTPEELETEWEAIKAAERAEGDGDQSPFAGIPRSMPALARAAKVLKRAERAGLAAPEVADLPIVDLLTADLAASDLTEDELGATLLAVVVAARTGGQDAEAALRSVIDAYCAQVDPPSVG